MDRGFAPQLGYPFAARHAVQQVFFQTGQIQARRHRPQGLPVFVQGHDAALHQADQRRRHGPLRPPGQVGQFFRRQGQLHRPVFSHGQTQGRAECPNHIAQQQAGEKVQDEKRRAGRFHRPEGSRRVLAARQGQGQGQERNTHPQPARTDVNPPPAGRFRH